MTSIPQDSPLWRALRRVGVRLGPSSATLELLPKLLDIVDHEAKQRHSSWSAKLSGSIASGTAVPGSDLDVLVHTHGQEATRDDRKLLAGGICNQLVAVLHSLPGFEYGTVHQKVRDKCDIFVLRAPNGEKVVVNLVLDAKTHGQDVVQDDEAKFTAFPEARLAVRLFKHMQNNQHDMAPLAGFQVDAIALRCAKEAAEAGLPADGVTLFTAMLDYLGARSTQPQNILGDLRLLLPNPRGLDAGQIRRVGQAAGNVLHLIQRYAGVEHMDVKAVLEGNKDACAQSAALPDVLRELAREHDDPLHAQPAAPDPGQLDWYTQMLAIATGGSAPTPHGLAAALASLQLDGSVKGGRTPGAPGAAAAQGLGPGQAAARLPCAYCGRSYTTGDALAQHVKVSHPGMPCTIPTRASTGTSCSGAAAAAAPGQQQAPHSQQPPAALIWPPPPAAPMPHPAGELGSSQGVGRNAFPCTRCARSFNTHDALAVHWQIKHVAAQVQAATPPGAGLATAQQQLHCQPSLLPGSQAEQQQAEPSPAHAQLELGLVSQPRHSLPGGQSVAQTCFPGPWPSMVAASAAAPASWPAAPHAGPVNAFPCSLCQRSFNSADAVALHARMKHGGAVPEATAWPGNAPAMQAAGHAHQPPGGLSVERGQASASLLVPGASVMVGGVPHAGVASNAFGCAHCLRSFTTVEGLALHMRMKHTQDTLHSPLLQQGLAEVGAPDAGMSLHCQSAAGIPSAGAGSTWGSTSMGSLPGAAAVGVNAHRCTLCLRSFTTRPGLELHVQMKHGGTGSSIPDPAPVVPQASALSQTAGSLGMPGVNPFPCTVCARSFSSAAALGVHCQVKHGR